MYFSPNLKYTCVALKELIMFFCVMITVFTYLIPCVKTALSPSSEMSHRSLCKYRILDDRNDVNCLFLIMVVMLSNIK